MSDQLTGQSNMANDLTVTYNIISDGIVIIPDRSSLGSATVVLTNEPTVILRSRSRPMTRVNIAINRDRAQTFSFGTPPIGTLGSRGDGRHWPGPD